jgi:hypothetical protein
MRLWFVFLSVTILALSLAPSAVPSLPGGPSPATGIRSAALPTGNATLELRVSPTTASIVVNGTPVALAANGSAEIRLEPGTYGVSASASGFRSFAGNVTVASREVQFLTVKLPVQPASGGGIGTPPTSFLVAITATALGVAAIVVLYVFLRRTPSTTASPASPRPEGGPPSDGATRTDEGPP